jgi:hypothetical protein
VSVTYNAPTNNDQDSISLSVSDKESNIAKKHDSKTVMLSKRRISESTLKKKDSVVFVVKKRVEKQDQKVFKTNQI